MVWEVKSPVKSPLNHHVFPGVSSPLSEAKTFEFGELRAQRKAVHLPFREAFATLPLWRDQPLVGGLEHDFDFSIQLGMSSSQLTNSYFSEG